ncbi:hypothetical protein FZX01_05430 [Listeria monocytogenes]|uniref:hypothetical protein n=1 Tax=Listeria monocytogenes TaxID=1639 RepID=UPI0011EB71C3|nr:hypothetical protein [Listeria monocytogenes]TYU88951.1 hypothetical protein FZX01_05430 [Listeria monocytogenes]
MTEGRNLTLVDIDSLDKKLLTDFYPKISHKQRKRIMDTVKLSAAYFEDDTNKDLMGLNQEELSQLSSEQQYILYENLVEMFYGCIAEL